MALFHQAPTVPLLWIPSALSLLKIAETLKVATSAYRAYCISLVLPYYGRVLILDRGAAMLTGIVDGSVPVQVLEQHYESLHGPLPAGYLTVRAKLERTITGEQAGEELNRALTVELYRHVPKPLFKLLEEEFQLLHGALPDGYLTEKKKIIRNVETIITDVMNGMRETEAAQGALEQLNDALVSEFYRSVPNTQAALCLSGGGIRSATFALGVLQGLARHGLLDQFHYLSTVSGGGYVGSWLTSWVHRKERELGPGKGLEAVIAELANPKSSKLDPEPEPMKHLRQYSNYLTPNLGWLSADTWTLIATYLRNLFINWLVWLPLLLAALLLPRFVVSVAAHRPHNSLWEVWTAFVLGFGLVSLALAYIQLCLPSIRSLFGEVPHFFKDRQGQEAFLRWCLLPLLIAAFLLTSAWAWLANSGKSLLPSLSPVQDLSSLLIFLIVGALVHTLAWAITAMLLLAGGGWRAIKNGIQKASKQDRTGRIGSLFLFLGNWFAIVVSGLTGGIVAWVLATKVFPSPMDKLDSYASLAVPLLLLSFLVAGTVYAAFTSRWTTDEDREWWARSGAWILIAMLGWSAGTGIAIFGPLVLFQSDTYAPLLAAVGGLSGLLTLILGFSGRTDGTTGQAEKPSWQERFMAHAPILAAPLAMVYLFVALVYFTSWAIQNVPWLLSPIPGEATAARLNVLSDPLHHLLILHQTKGWRLSLLFQILITISFVLAVVVNVNKFSLHAIYRSRLIRTYLGASRGRRHPNPFTGFDPDDNLEMYQLQPTSVTSEAGSHRLLHILNIALNLVQQRNETLAWQERKAESFTVSALHAGNWRLGYRNAGDYGRNPHGIAIRLGTAVAISGAAASPNMGYHSSPAVTFLMTLFNLRLGWWLGNPGVAGNATFRRSCPTVAIQPILAEAFGFTNDRNPYVYLSDGGHFENLGLYEMVLRRCRFILAIDVGRDPDCAFEDLGNAIRKIRVDLGVPILFKKICIYPRTSMAREREDSPKYCAIGTIIYSRLDPNEPDGELIYIKPALCEEEPADIYNYAQRHPGFPHEPTSDQWFSESQFESYRMLGSHTLEQMCGSDWQAEFDKVKDKIWSGQISRLAFFRSQVDRYLKKTKGLAAESVMNGDGAGAPLPLAGIGPTKADSVTCPTG